MPEAGVEDSPVELEPLTEPEPEPQIEVEELQSEIPPDESEGEKGPSLEDSRFYKRDIYGEIDKIETRGKSLKEKRSWGLGSGKSGKAKPEPVQEPEPTPKPQPEQDSEPEPPEETPWQPLSGRRLKKAEDALVDFKRKLDKGFKSGQLSREQCISMVTEKEIELGLKPPT
jgi:hypothetical protein